jgi:uncharacterized glyoxalase superfamily protein PhnB
MHLKSLVPILRVLDVDKSLAFYQEALHFDVLHRYEQDGHLHWALAKSGEIALMFARCPTAQGVLLPAKKDDLVLYFQTDDIATLHATLTAKGYRVSAVRGTFYGMQECDLTDPDGYQLWFGQATNTPSTVHEA